MTEKLVHLREVEHRRRDLVLVTETQKVSRKQVA